MHEVTSRLPVAESIDKSYATTLDLMKTYPDLKGIISFGSLGPIGAGQAIQNKRAKGKVAVVGIAMPAQAAPYLMRGDIKKRFFGILKMQVMHWLLSPINCWRVRIFLRN